MTCANNANGGGMNGQVSVRVWDPARDRSRGAGPDWPPVQQGYAPAQHACHPFGTHRSSREEKNYGVCVRCVALLGQARCTTRRTSSTWTILTTWLSWMSTLSRSSTVLGTTLRPMAAGILSDKWWLVVGTGTASSSGCRWTIHRRVLPTISPTKSKKSNGGTLSLSPPCLCRFRSLSFFFLPACVRLG